MSHAHVLLLQILQWLHAPATKVVGTEWTIGEPQKKPRGQPSSSRVHRRSNPHHAMPFMVRASWCARLQGLAPRP